MGLQISARSRDGLMIATINSAVFGSFSTLPFSLVWLVDWSVSQLVKRTYCQITLIVSSPGIL